MKTTVKFVDISEEPDEMLPSIEGTVMKLPQDFLYPLFISYSLTLQCNIITIMFIQMLLFVA